MLIQNGTVNYGFCQGLVKGEVYSPFEGKAMVNIHVKANRKNPQTKKYPIFVLNFIAHGDNAKMLMDECKSGEIVLVRYHLDSSVRFDMGNGISKTVHEQVIDDLIISPQGMRSSVAWLNKGYFQGRLVGITRKANAKGICTVNLVSESKEGGLHFNFTVFGDLGKAVEEKFQKGELVMIEYKIEKNKRVFPDGQSEYFTNYVVERIW